MTRHQPSDPLPDEHSFAAAISRAWDKPRPSVYACEDCGNSAVAQKPEGARTIGTSEPYTVSWAGIRNLAEFGEPAVLSLYTDGAVCVEPASQGEMEGRWIITTSQELANWIFGHELTDADCVTFASEMNARAAAVVRNYRALHALQDES